MFRGLKALFTTGLILNPMVLFGIVAGAIFYFKFDIETIMDIFSYYDYYLVALSLAFLFTIFFNLAFKSYGKQVDWKATSARCLVNFIRLVSSNMLSVIFFYMISIF